MDIATLTNFFIWCTIINGSLYLFWAMFLLFTPDLVYRIQFRFFPIPRETYNVIIYSFLGLFKIFFIFFNIVPLVSLLIIR
ncbi:MAG: hypothetical protein QNL05_02300 [Gammaproteobacteria bacterium]|nr:hypothetical protein [Gammaproteobacteria bacterium]MDX2486355.1 hypothetical protein [Gammaproteobacteria bacterium]